MRIEIVDDLADAASSNRIEEIEDDQDVDTCFICNNEASTTKTIFSTSGTNFKC